jgi:hypothetical protein
MDFATLERRRLTAIIETDAGALDALHHDDFVLCTPSGAVWDREFYLGGLISGRISYTTFEPVSDIEVMASADLAVLRYRSIIDIAIEGSGGGSRGVLAPRRLRA